MRSASPKLPAFAGRCHVQVLPGEAARRADDARYLAKWRSLSPEETRAKVNGNMNKLLGLGLLLLLAWALAGCSPSRATTEAHSTRLEHAAPAAYSPWHEANTVGE